MKHLEINNPDYQRLLTELNTELTAKQYSRPATQVSMVKEFFFFLESRNVDNIKAVKAVDIISYYNYLQERPNQRRAGGLSNSVLNTHIFSVRLLFDYLLQTQQIDGSPAHLPKFNIGKSKEREVLSIEEIKEMYKVAADKRERAVLTLAYGCGLRRSEIKDLNVADVILNKGYLIVRDGKFHKTRQVPLSDNVIKELKEYLIYERGKWLGMNYAEPAFILNYLGRRLAGGHINKLIEYIVERTSITKRITLHNLRHSIATHLLDQGADIWFLKSFLGHEGIDTSHIYSKKRKQRMNILSQIN